MNSKSLQIHKRGQGQSLVEFALILPILIIVLVGVFDLGRALFALITITNAAREGARYGTLHFDEPDDLNVRQAAVDEAYNINIPFIPSVVIDINDVTVYCPDDSSLWPCARGDAIRVTVNYTFESLLKVVIPADINMSRSVEMAVP